MSGCMAEIKVVLVSPVADVLLPSQKPAISLFHTQKSHDLNLE